MENSDACYEKLKELSVEDLVGVLITSVCSRCPAKKDNCSDNDAMCMDAIRDWLNGEGEL